MKVIEKVRDWKAKAAGLAAAAIPLGLTLDPNNTIGELAPMVISLFTAFLPIIIIFMLFSIVLKSLNQKRS